MVSLSFYKLSDLLQGTKELIIEKSTKDGGCDVQKTECVDKIKGAQHKIRVAARCVKWSIPWMLGKRLIRFTFTFIVYLIECLLLLKVFDLLFGDVTGLKPFASLLNFKPAIWIVSGPIAFLNTLPPVQLLSNTIARGLNMNDPPIKAIGSVIGAIGIGSTFIAWLTSSAERLVCGIRTGELLNWVHRFFFEIYALVFLPLAFLGIFASNSNHWEAAVFALLGVLLGLAFTLLVCFEFVLSAKWREELALQYYHKMVRPFIATCWIRWGGHLWEPARTVSPNIHENARRAMLSVADYLRNQAEMYHRNFSSNMVRLWIYSCWIPFGEQSKFSNHGMGLEPVFVERPAGTTYPEDYCSTYFKDGQPHFKINVDWTVHYPTTYISDAQDYIVAHTLLAKDVWAELLPTDTLTPQDLTITRQILYSLWELKQDQRYIVVLLGLLFCLEDAFISRPSQTNITQLITKIDFITRSDAASGEQDNVPKEVRSELAWALLMLCVAAWIQEGTGRDCREILDIFCRHFSAELNEYCEDLTRIKSAGDIGGHPTETDIQAEAAAKIQRGNIILWYAEWIARKRRGLSLDRYLMGISSMFGQGNTYTHFRLGEFSYRKTFLLDILCEHYFNISRKNGTEEDKDNER